MRIREVMVGKSYICNTTGEIGRITGIVEGIMINVTYEVNGASGKCSIDKFRRDWSIKT